MKKFKRTGTVEAGLIQGFNYRGWNEKKGVHEYFCTVDGQTVEVDAEAAARLQNQAGNATPVGGYLVRYSDGWLGWCPAKVFEASHDVEKGKKA